MTERAVVAKTETVSLSDSYSVDGDVQTQFAIRYARRLRHWISVCLLALADILAFAFAALLFRIGRPVPALAFAYGPASSPTTTQVFYILAVAFIVVRYLVGDYSRRQLFWDGSRQTTIALIVTSAPSFLILMFSNIHYSVFAEVGSWTFLLFAVPVLRQFARWLMSRFSIWQLPTVLVGDGPNAMEAFDAFNKSLSLGFSVKFLISLDDADDAPTRLDGITKMPLRDHDAIVRRLTNDGCLEAVLAADGRSETEVEDLMQRFIAAGLGVAVIPPVKRLPLLGLTTSYFFGRDLLLLQVRNNLGRLPGQVFKRGFDIVGAVVLLTLCSPLFAFIFVRVWLGDGGPALFTQRRVGQHGQEFNCIKFRTMHLNAEEQLSRWKQENSLVYAEYVASNFKLRNDPRVTRVGRILRRTSLDELPQLINVLKGDMSLVGPRPLIAREVADYGPSFKLYQLLRPGITGLWQISGRSNTTFADRVAADEWYIKNWSFWYDIVILLKTAGVLVEQKGAF